jgi:3'-phosphoadenosine 5'-phosphosulfate sulfotransferase (PAPS reductase)/FAD synthetase/ubiquinone/menaquinone biosynthesis C-methylase UbiE
MNVAAVEDATGRLMERGMRVLNAHLFAQTELAHVARLLELMKPANGAVVLDAGCGVGEVALLMRELRPDLSFVLLNVSEMQLAHCPQDMRQVNADFAATGLADASVDVVMFNYSLCHSLDVPGALREAQRVLREGGILFVNDMVRREGDNRLARALLDTSHHYPAHIAAWAQQAGFDADELLEHTPVVERLREVMGDAAFDLVLHGTYPATFRFIKRTITDPVDSAFSRHENIAFQFSGGRDSTAALYLLRPYWDRMTVYHLDTGDQFPETQAVVNAVSQHVGVVRITSDVHRIREEHGMPSDVVPVDNTPVGQMVSGREVRLQSRYDCCWRSLMSPMHERMRSDGITLIVRGQRDDEYANPPKRSGGTGDGFEVLYPIQSWSAGEVNAFLQDNALPVAPFYERGARRAPECMGCTAWWDEGRADYLRVFHPAAFDSYEKRMRVIRIEVDRQLAMLEAPIGSET